MHCLKLWRWPEVLQSENFRGDGVLMIYVNLKLLIFV